MMPRPKLDRSQLGQIDRVLGHLHRARHSTSFFLAKVAIDDALQALARLRAEVERDTNPEAVA